MVGCKVTLVCLLLISKYQDYDPNLGVSILRDMSDEKKATFCKIIQTMGNIDGSPFEATKEAVEHIIVKARLLGSLKNIQILSMVRYSIKQKKAVISLVFAAMIVDNKEINDRRSAYLQVVADLMQVYNDMFKDVMNNMSHEESIAILNEMSSREKRG